MPIIKIKTNKFKRIKSKNPKKLLTVKSKKKVLIQNMIRSMMKKMKVRDPRKKTKSLRSERAKTNRNIVTTTKRRNPTSR